MNQNTHKKKVLFVLASRICVEKCLNIKNCTKSGVRPDCKKAAKKGPVKERKSIKVLFEKSILSFEWFWLNKKPWILMI